MRDGKLLRRIAATFTVMIAISACGGGDSTKPDAVTGDAASTSTETSTEITSDDGVLTVEIPQGLADGGQAFTVSPIAADDLPEDLQRIDPSAIVLAYDLGPDGSSFDEPASVTFRIDPTNYGLELPEAALPVVVLLTTNASGELEVVESAEVTREGEAIVLRTRISHFSPTVAVFDSGSFLELSPGELGLTVGQSETVSVSLSVSYQSEVTSRLASDDDHPWEWEAVAPFSISSDKPLTAEVTCGGDSDGVVEDAYSLRVPVAWVDEHLNALWAVLISNLDLFGFGSEKVTIFSLSGDATCDEPDESSSEAVDLGPRSTQNPANQIDAAGQSSPVAINRDDCFNDDGTVECAAEIDVIALAWEEVDGAADLLSLTVTFAGPVDGDGDVLIDVGIWPRGNGSPLGTRIEIGDGVFSCKFPGSDGPLPGESCEVEVNEDGNIAVVRDISGMSGRIDVAIAAIHFDLEEDGALIRDAAQIQGILERE